MDYQDIPGYIRLTHTIRSKVQAITFRQVVRDTGIYRPHLRDIVMAYFSLDTYKKINYLYIDKPQIIKFIGIYKDFLYSNYLIYEEANLKYGYTHETVIKRSMRRKDNVIFYAGEKYISKRIFR